ncbi:MAG: hypothetical protein ACYTDU_08965 [Planctomycetota bacterium]|jgi:hypothetical protein
MRTPWFVLIIVASFLLGWFTHGWTVEEPIERTPGYRKAVDARRAREAPVAPEPVAPRPVVEAPSAPDAAEAPDGAAEAEEGAKEADPIAEMIRSQSAAWVGFATMQAKQKLKGLLAALGFDEETAKAIEEAILAEVARQTELAIQMMLGDAEMDIDAFAYFMGLPPDLSTELAGELGTFLDDDEIASVRREVKKAYKEQLTAMADMQLGMMQIHDLSDDQRTRMRELFSTDVMQDQFGMFAEVTRDRGKLTRLMNDPEGLTKVMQRNLAPTRQQVRDILNDEQFKKYEAYEQSIVKQMEMGLRMMGSLTQPPKRKTPKPDGP